MKFALLAALATFVIGTSAISNPESPVNHVIHGVNNGLSGEPAPYARRSRIAPGDSNAERIRRGLAPKAPGGIFHKKSTRTAGAKRSSPSPISGPSNVNILAKDVNGDPKGYFWHTANGLYVTLSDTAGFNFEHSTANVASEQGISFGGELNGVPATDYIDSVVMPQGGTVTAGGGYIVFSYSQIFDNGNPEYFCYTQGNGYELSNWGWGQGVYNTPVTYQWFNPTSTVSPNFYYGNDDIVYAAMQASDITNQNPPLDESARITLEWVES